MRYTGVARLGLLTFLFVPASASARQTFEGVITYRITVEGQSVTMRQMSKGTVTRSEVEMPGMPGPMYMLLDTERQVMQMVMASMGMYMEVDLAQAVQAAPPELRNQPAKLTKLGTSATIAGLPCEDYRLGEDADEMEACIATGYGWFMSASPPGGGRGGGPNLGPDLSAYRAEFKDGMIPLRLKTRVNGEWTVMMEATEVTKKSLDAALFRLPDGLRKMSLQGG